MKLSAVRSIVSGKRRVLVDDSIVRGTTCKRIVGHLFAAGAREVHVRIASAPLCHLCFYGIDLHSEDELIAAKLNQEEICEHIGATSLRYLPLETMYKIMGQSICAACFTGNYPIPIPEKNPLYDFDRA